MTSVMLLSDSIRNPHLSGAIFSMSIKLSFSLLCCLFFLSNGCDSKPGGNQNSTPANTQPSASASPTGQANSASEAKPEPGANTGTAVKSALDACGLIEKSEIEAVQGGKVQGTVPGSRAEVAFVISQCYYTVFSSDGSKNFSVHLEVSQNDPKNPNQNAVGDLWREKFQEAKATKEMEKPKPVPGVGDGAYWVGNDKVGALYVLKKDKLVRISLGGPDEEKAKIEKSKALAEKALNRLS